LLSRGDFARGWADYEWRWKSKIHCSSAGTRDWLRISAHE
jgi:hypothetical protein